MPIGDNELALRLRKILEHELRLECQDAGVAGGIEPLVARWAASAIIGRAELGTIATLLSGYKTMPVGERRRRVERAIAMLDRGANGTAVADATPARQPEVSTPPNRSTPPGKTAAPRSSPASSPPVNIEHPSPSAASVRRRPKPVEAVANRKPAQLDVPVTRVRGVSTGYARLLSKLGVNSVHDLLYHFPRRYVDYRDTKRVKDLALNELETVLVTIWEVHSRRARNGMPIVEMLAGDETGTIGAVWFNQSHLTKSLVANRQIALSGRVEEGSHGQPYFKSPDWEVLGEHELVHVGRLVPVFPLTEGITGRWLRRLVKFALDHWSQDLVDPLPAPVRRNRALVDLHTAIWQMHFPDDETMRERARRRLAFDELLLIQLAMLQRRLAWVNTQQGHAFHVDRSTVDHFLTTLPFQLTAGQRRAVEGILGDMAKSSPMARLLQGDVGSGKTVVAAMAMLVAVADGTQCVVMAPTEILAEQHFRTLWTLFERLGPIPREGVPSPQPLAVRLLTGSIAKREKIAIYEEAEAGNVDVLVGTHAVLQHDLRLSRLGLAIIDEQHRFGVEQRGMLRSKGENPDLLVMTATPIPRTLALTLYGDLDISSIDELPPGRQEIKTLVLAPQQRPSAYQFVQRHVEDGEQAFVICPLVEESDKVEAKAATAEYERLQRDVFTTLRVGLVHGRMAAREKDATMRAFRAGALQVLVSTAVVEVGIDVPNATIMLVEGADRFGLAQLHQFRGRVGRGTKKSYCILLSDSPSAEAEERLQAVARVSDGCALAEEDLRLRGPGEVFGTRQSGLPELRVASLADITLLEEARAEAQALLALDPTLARPEHRILARELASFWRSAEHSYDG